MKLQKHMLVSALLFTGAIETIQPTHAAQINYTKPPNKYTEDLAEKKKRELELLEKSPGPGDLNLMKGLDSIADVYMSNLSYDLAAPFLERASAIERRNNPLDTRLTQKLAMLYIALQDYPKAEPLLNICVEAIDSAPKAQRPGLIDYNLLALLQQQGLAALKQGKLDNAGRCLERAKKLYDGAKTARLKEPYSAAFLSIYADYLSGIGRIEESQQYKTRYSVQQAKDTKRCLACGMG